MQPGPEINQRLSETIIWDLIASIADAVVTIDENHRIVFCNRVAERMFGYDSGELIGKDVSPLIPEPHFAAHRGYVDRYVRTREGRVIGKSRECFGRRRDGSSFPVEISYSTSETEGKLYFTAVIRDISERKAMERELRFMEKLASVGKAVAHVVHEIRKPLMLIGGFARQVADNIALQGDENSRRKLRIVVEEVRRLEALLSGISLLSRPPSMSEKRDIHLGDLLLETLALFEPMLQGRRVALDTDFALETLVVKGDPDQIKQVLLNLLHNAVDCFDNGGSIGVRSGRNADKAEIEVSNDGPPIAPETLPRIFDPFFTTKPDGTGLGLAITRNIVHDHGGAISVRSEAGGGTSFLISLPLADENGALGEHNA